MTFEGDGSRDPGRPVPQPPSGTWAPPGQPGPKAHGLAVASLVAGLVGLVPCFFGVPGLIAVVCGLLGLRAISRDPHGSSGRGMAITGVVLGSLELLGFIAFAALVAISAGSGTTSNGSDESSSPTIATAGGEPLELGQCTSRPESDSGDPIAVVDCSVDHGGEVYHVETLPDGEYPGQTAAARRADGICTEAFADFVGIDYDSSELEVFYLYPLRSQWSLGDRDVVCILLDPAGDLPPGSAREASR